MDFKCTFQLLLVYKSKSFLKSIKEVVQMKKTQIIALLILGVLAGGAFAFNGGMKQHFEEGDYESYLEEHNNRQMTEEQFNEKAEQFQVREQNREQVQVAIEAEDYDAWVLAKNNMPRITDVINEDNFDTFVEMHNEGDNERARELAQELGLPHKGMMQRNKRR